MTDNSIIESVVIGGDLSKLNPDQRVSYYKAVCTSLGLNPLTKPFSYITLNNRLTLYANKDAADQLRNLKNISIDKPEITFQDEWIIVTVVGYDGTGRKDSDVGVVNKKDMRGDFGNALMKAVTKAKRRVTLSICGLGMLDETEIDTIPNANPITVTETGVITTTATDPKPEKIFEPPSDKAWTYWDELVDTAMKYNLAVPEINKDSTKVTAAELHEANATLDKRIKLYVKAGGGASTSAPAAQEQLNS